MKVLIAVLVLTQALIANAADSGLECTMSYSGSGPLSATTDSTTEWLVEGSKMTGSAVSADKNGGWTQDPANFLNVKKQNGLWVVEILNDKNEFVSSFSFGEKAAMKATIPTKAFMANEGEDPEEYDQLVVSCAYAEFAG